MELTGRSIIGFRRGAQTGVTLRATSPATGLPIEPEFHSASSDEIDLACKLASGAFEKYGRLPGRARGEFLRRIAQNVEALGDQLVERAVLETGLPAGRIQSETVRTCNQLLMFAALIEEGSALLRRKTISGRWVFAVGRSY